MSIEPALAPKPAWHYGMPTVAVMLAAVVASLAYWMDANVAILFMSYRVFEGELWRLATSALVHGDIIHLVFNLFWLHRFGLIVERHFGAWQTLALMAFLNAVSIGAEYLFFVGGSGLSGVGYGLFGMLWWLQRKDVRFANAIDRNTALLFVGWFFFCIVLTVSNVYAVANVAHAVGALYGVVIGWVVTAKAGQRLPRWAVVMVSSTMLFAATAIARPYVNLSPKAGAEYEQAAYVALNQNHDERAADLCLRGLRLDPNDAYLWFSLGTAMQRMQKDEAQDAYQHAYDLEPKSVQYRGRLGEWKAYYGTKALEKNHDEEAVRNLEAAVRLNDRLAWAWYNLAVGYLRLGKLSDSRTAFQRAVELDPAFEQNRQAVAEWQRP